MAITARQKELVQLAFASIMRNPERFSERFYKRLFEIAPAFVHLFRRDIFETRRKLMITMLSTVNTLSEAPEMLQTLHEVADRHKGYRVQSEDFAQFGEALTWAFEQELGAAFNAETKAAWQAVYAWMAGIVMARLAE